jgi:peptidoglycan/xylan/chitin deacetylase (PgdA/CDA1 family)
MAEAPALPERFSYSAIVDRPPLAWPGGARVALWVVPNIEHYEYLPRSGAAPDPWPRTPHPDVLGYANRDYGNRVGFWRMLEVLDKYSIRCTASLNLAVLEHFPEIHEAMSSRDWEHMCHGRYNTRAHWGMSETEERAAIAECIALFRKLTGRDFRGWFSPAVSQTVHTADLVADAGISYTCDYYHDDQPTPIRTRSGRTLISLPYAIPTNDMIVYMRNGEGPDFAQAVCDSFDTIYRESAASGRVVCVAVHPFYIGAPHRVKYLDRALSHILRHDGIWQATGSEISDWYTTSCLKRYRQHLGAEA